MLFTLLLTAQILTAQPTDNERTWRTPSELHDAINTLAVSNKDVSVTTIGSSRSTQPIVSIRVSMDGAISPENRPAILIVAGIDGDHLLGSEVAVEIVQELLNRD